jgi:hypothetical protein
MRMPSWRAIVPLFLIVWMLAMLTPGRPGTVAHATEGQRSWDAGHAAVVSAQNENTTDDDDDTADNDDDADNSEDNTDEDDSDGDDNSNDNRGEVVVVPVSVPAPAGAAPPPPSGQASSAVDEVSQCLPSGGVLVYQGPQAGIAVTSYQNNLNVTLTRVDPAAQPAPPGAIVGSYVFRMSASPCGGAPYTVLPSEVNLALSYSDTLAAGRDESRFALMRYDGTSWSTAPKLFRDAANNHVSASVTGLGVYALVQQ